MRQGFFGIFEVFADTIIVCTLTGLAILCSGAAIPYGTPATLSLCVSAFAGVFGGAGAAAILSACMLLFSLSSLLGWGMYGLRACGFRFGGRSARGFVLLYALSAVLGAAGARSMIWEIADLLNALMALPKPHLALSALRRGRKAHAGIFRSETEGIDLAHLFQAEG